MDWMKTVAKGSAALVTTVVATAAAAQAPWLDAGGAWVRLPSQTPAGPLPQTFTTPTRAYDYGAATRALSSSVTAQPSIVRVYLSDIRGPVGVSLAKPDGSALISREKVVAPALGTVIVYFRVATPVEVAVLLRNPGVEGQGGAATVRAVQFAFESSISAAERQQIQAAGVN